jgi:hypothetical protein
MLEPWFFPTLEEAKEQAVSSRALKGLSSNFQKLPYKKDIWNL